MITENDTMAMIGSDINTARKTTMTTSKAGLKVLKLNFKALYITGSVLWELLKKAYAVSKDDFSDYSALARVVRNEIIKSYHKKGVSLDRLDYNIEEMKIFKKIMKQNNIKFVIQKLGNGEDGKDFTIFFQTRDSSLIQKALEDYERELYKRCIKNNKTQETKTNNKAHDRNYEKEDVNDQRTQEFYQGEQDIDKDIDRDGVFDRVDVDINDNRVKNVADLDKREGKNKSKGKDEKRSSLLDRLSRKKEEIKNQEDKDKNKELKKEKTTERIR
jgi:hypothetical protein